MGVLAAGYQSNFAHVDYGYYADQAPVSGQVRASLMPPRVLV